jgi:putative membrane protein
MPILFVDPLDLWLMLLGTSLLVVAYWIYLNYISGRPEDYKRSVNRNLAFFFILVGLYAFITGIWATITWPFPGPYNIVLANPWPIFGIALLLLGVSQLFGFNPVAISYGLAALGFPILVYGIAIYSKGLTREPLLSALMYVLIALATLGGPILAYYGGNGRGRIIAYIAIAMLVIAALISIYTGANATFGHIDGWKPWTPWYGRVEVPG